MLHLICYLCTVILLRNQDIRPCLSDPVRTLKEHILPETERERERQRVTEREEKNDVIISLKL